MVTAKLSAGKLFPMLVFWGVSGGFCGTGVLWAITSPGSQKSCQWRGSSMLCVGIFTSTLFRGICHPSRWVSPFRTRAWKLERSQSLTRKWKSKSEAEGIQILTADWHGRSWIWSWACQRLLHQSCNPALALTVDILFFKSLASQGLNFFIWKINSRITELEATLRDN